VLDCDSTNVAVSIEIENRILIEILCFDDFGLTELDVQGVGIPKVLYFHGSNDRSKNALCTVSPSGSKMTRNSVVARSVDAALLENNEWFSSVKSAHKHMFLRIVSGASTASYFSALRNRRIPARPLS
jgi:hypothetical protein